MPESSDNSVRSFRFSEVALPLPPRRTFTYCLPAPLRYPARLGARVIVPFGPRLLTGYIVALHRDLDPELGVEESSVKDITELVDEAPLISDEILELTRWAADYYAASWGELLKASLPAGINAAVEQVVRITEAGRARFMRSISLKKVGTQILKRLAGEPEITRRELEKEFGSAGVARSIRDLLGSGDIEIESRIATEKVKP